MPAVRHSAPERLPWGVPPRSKTNPCRTVDANGNLIQKTEDGSVWAYTWNAENQLTRVTKDSAEVATFAYDPLGRRVEKAAGAVTTSFAYDGEDILRETRTGGTLFKYVHGPGIDEPLGREDQTTALNYYHVDGLGSVLKRSNQAASIVHEYRYDAWGNIELGAGESGYAFTGREWDPETELYYYRARLYDARAARFLSEDPIRLGDGPNLYLYARSRPLYFVDPFGDKTKVIVTGNRMGRFEYGTHAALYFDNGPRGPFLYDPAGSYRNETRGACGCFEGEEADLEDYLKYHLQTPNEFYTVFVFDTTAEEEAELYRKIDPDNAKDPRGINCALMVSKVLSGTGPFKNLKPTRYPAHLQKELLDLLK